MNAADFDRLARLLNDATSRRSLLAFTFGGGLASSLVSLEGEAWRRRRKKKKRKRCKADCTGRTCGTDGCSGSCGACVGDMTCQNGTCACPQGTEACGGACLPLCPPSSGPTVIARHPATCECCIRPAAYSCEVTLCCGEPDSLPCCGPLCDPLAIFKECREPRACHYDVECGVGRHCSGNIDPRTCEDDT